MQEMTTQPSSGTLGTVTVGSCPSFLLPPWWPWGEENRHSVSPLCEVHAEQLAKVASLSTSGSWVL